MSLKKYFPSEVLRAYIKYFIISENELEGEYKVYPFPGLVVGFQYRGQLSTGTYNSIKKLDAAGITGIAETYKIFRNSSGIGTVLVYFTETGFNHFTAIPANELFNLSISLDNVFKKDEIAEVKERLADASSDRERISIVEEFFLSQLRDISADKLIKEAVRLIYETSGRIRIKELNRKLFISQSPFEKRFRRVVGTSPKKFTSIIRFNKVLHDLQSFHSLTEIGYNNNFFDQAHFIKEFKHLTGEAPENFRRLM